MFVVGEDRDFKFGRQVDSSKSWPTDDRKSMKGPWPGYDKIDDFVGAKDRETSHLSTFVPQKSSLARQRQFFEGACPPPRHRLVRLCCIVIRNKAVVYRRLRIAGGV